MISRSRSDMMVSRPPARMEAREANGQDAAKPESREPRSIRFTPSEWGAICQAARLRAEEPSRFVRRLAMYALSIVQAQAAAEASLGHTGFGRV